MTFVKIDANRITDWDSFHRVFAQTFGFPEFYGRNMDSWIDCMSYLNDPTAGMAMIHTLPGDAVTLHVEHARDFACRCPEQYAALVECAAFVNVRKVEAGDPALLTLSLDMS